MEVQTVMEPDVVWSQADVQSVTQELGEETGVLCEVTGLLQSVGQQLGAGTDILSEATVQFPTNEDYCGNNRDGTWNVVPSSDVNEHSCSTIISLILNISRFQSTAVATVTSEVQLVTAQDDDMGGVVVLR